MLYLCDLPGPWPGPAVPGLQSWRALRGDVGGWRHYWGGSAESLPPLPAGARWEALRPGTDLCGPESQHAAQSWPHACSTSGQAPYHYVVETDVAEGGAQDLQAWYEQEHLPGLASVPGCLRARRLLREPVPAGLPLHLACYELLSPEVTESAPWLAVRYTAWSDRVRPLFRNTRRTMFIRPDLLS